MKDTSVHFKRHSSTYSLQVLRVYVFVMVFTTVMIFGYIGIEMQELSQKQQESKFFQVWPSVKSASPAIGRSRNGKEELADTQRQLGNQFSEIDADKDGVISQKEWDAARDKGIIIIAEREGEAADIQQRTDAERNDVKKKRSSHDNRQEHQRDGNFTNDASGDSTTTKVHAKLIEWLMHALDAMFPWLRRRPDEPKASSKLIDVHFAMGIGAWVFLICCGCAFILCQGGMIFICQMSQISDGFPSITDDFRRSFDSLTSFVIGWIPNPSYVTVGEVNEDKSQLLTSYAPLLRREALFMLLLPFIPLLFLSSSSCENGTPDAVYYTYLPFLVRHYVIEARLLWILGAPWTSYVVMIFASTFEHSDWFTDGLFPTQSFVCDAVLTPSFAWTFRHSSFAFLDGLVFKMRFWGIAAILFIATALPQQIQVRTNTPFTDKSPNNVDCGSVAIAADTGAFLAISGYAEDMHQRQIKSSVRVSKKEAMTPVSKILLENCIQLRLQSSAFALTFGATSRWAKMKALLSLSLGVASASSKTCAFVFALFQKSALFGFVASLIGLLIFLVIAWTITQIYQAFACPTHLWNLTTGCVVLN